MAALAINDDDFDEAWLRSKGFLVVPEESGLHLVEAQCERLARALSQQDVHRLVGVAVELVPEEFPVWRLEATHEDLAAYSFEAGSFNYLLFDDGGVRCAVFCSAELDTLLFAGSRAFLEAYFGSLSRAVSEYWTYSEVHLERLWPKLRGYLRHAAWVDTL